MELDNIKLLALGLIFSPRHFGGEILSSLDENDWSRIGILLRQHRVEPMLYWRISAENRANSLPADFFQRLEASYKSSTLRSLNLQRELLRVHHILERAAIPHMMLKGAFLAFHAYPHPGMRPMRDLDVLVPRDRALIAYQALLKAGFQSDKKYKGEVSAALDVMHHLPGLNSADGQVHIELHTRLFHERPWKISSQDLGEKEEFWRRSVCFPIAGTSMPFSSATDLLLHMAVHGVYDHKFNNGPLLLSDIAYLLGSQSVDWALFWRMAREMGYERGCILALKLTESYYGDLDVVWPSSPDCRWENIPVHEAALAMFQNTKFRKALLLSSNMESTPSWYARIRYFTRKVFPSRRALSAAYAVSPSSIRICLMYPVKWWDMLKTRVPSLIDRSLYSEAAKLQIIDRWLQR